MVYTQFTKVLSTFGDLLRQDLAIRSVEVDVAREKLKMFEAGHANRSEEAFIVQRDWRADGGMRRVRVTRRDILIARRFGGVAMRISVPAPAYRGVLLEVVTGDDGAPRYRLALVHSDRDLDVALCDAVDAAAAAADWKDWADWFGLPRLAAQNGDFAVVDDEKRRGAAPRRGASSVRCRRPRFLACRKRGDVSRLATIFASEREIIAPA